MTASRRILIVEDEPLIAMMLEDFIETLGHSCVGTADSIQSAMPFFRKGGFDAAILDVNLRSGELCWPLADALLQDGKPYVLASGGQADPLPERFATAPALCKPYTMDGVREVLDGLFPS